MKIDAVCLKDFEWNGVNYTIGKDIDLKQHEFNILAEKGIVELKGTVHLDKPKKVSVKPEKIIDPVEAKEAASDEVGFEFDEGFLEEKESDKPNAPVAVPTTKRRKR
jgi:hypothetical protein